MAAEKNDGIDQLSQIYEEIDEAGKEKLKEVSSQILNIWATVHEKRPEKSKLENEL
jgi:hypothetical protein